MMDPESTSWYSEEHEDLFPEEGQPEAVTFDHERSVYEVILANAEPNMNVMDTKKIIKKNVLLSSTAPPPASHLSEDNCLLNSCYNWDQFGQTKDEPTQPMQLPRKRKASLELREEPEPDAADIIIEKRTKLNDSVFVRTEPGCGSGKQKPSPKNKPKDRLQELAKKLAKQRTGKLCHYSLRSRETKKIKADGYDDLKKAGLKECLEKMIVIVNNPNKFSPSYVIEMQSKLKGLLSILDQTETMHQMVENWTPST